MKDSNPQSPNPKLGAFTNLAKDAYSTSIQKPFPYNKKKTIPMLPTLSYLSPTKKKIDLSSDLLKNFLLTMSHWLIPTLETTYLSYFLMYVSSGLVENPIQLCPTGKKIPFSIYSIYI